MGLRDIFKRNPAKAIKSVHSYNLPYLEIMKGCEKGAYLGAGNKRKFVSEDKRYTLIFFGTLYESAYEFFEATCDVWYEDSEQKRHILFRTDGVSAGPYKIKVIEEGSKDAIRDWLLSTNCNFKEEKW